MVNREFTRDPCDNQGVTVSRQDQPAKFVRGAIMANITVTFGAETRSNHAITAGWIRAAMEAQDRDGQPICGKVHVEGGGINVYLAVGSCPAGSGGARPPNAAERHVLELFRRRHLDQATFAPGELEAFVKQALRL
jgi:hypothetical protein